MQDLNPDQTRCFLQKKKIKPLGQKKKIIVVAKLVTYSQKKKKIGYCCCFSTRIEGL
jgi:hypothetical protein